LMAPHKSLLFTPSQKTSVKPHWTTSNMRLATSA